ncbi:MAG TPA: hypothetical protein VFK59_07555 [Actinomycetota bacterium]|nr:hypothetical protein [Actinomycetota bacterium]
MESVAEGYTAPDPAGSGEGPWATPGAAEPSPALEDGQAHGPPLSATEEALVRALAEVDRVEAELRSIEPLRERLVAELEQASAHADALIAQVSESYARDQLRLEGELRTVQKRLAGLERIRETRLARPASDDPGRNGGPAPGLTFAEPPQGASHEPTPSPVADAALPLELAKDDGKTKKLGVVKAMNRNGRGKADAAVAAPEPTPEPTLDLPIAPAAGTISAPGVATAVPKADGANGHRADANPDPSEPRKKVGSTTEPAEGEAAAYEDHWYQVLRRDSLGGTS